MARAAPDPVAPIFGIIPGMISGEECLLAITTRMRDRVRRRPILLRIPLEKEVPFILLVILLKSC